MWILFIVFWFHEGYGGGLSTQTVKFNNANACEEFAKQVKRDYKDDFPKEFQQSSKITTHCYKINDADIYLNKE